MDDTAEAIVTWLRDLDAFHRRWPWEWEPRDSPYWAEQRELMARKAAILARIEAEAV